MTAVASWGLDLFVFTAGSAKFGNDSFGEDQQIYETSLHIKSPYVHNRTTKMAGDFTHMGRPIVHRLKTHVPPIKKQSNSSSTKRLLTQ